MSNNLVETLNFQADRVEEWSTEYALTMRLSAAGMSTLEQQRDELLAALVDTLDFVERHSNRWDGENGKHPFVVVEAARLAIANAKPANA